MARTVPWVALLGAVVLLLPRGASALDHTEPTIRVGASLGVFGSLPLGDDVGQDGYPDEFEKALWVHADVLHVDIGDYRAVGGFFRFAVAGGYSEDTLAQSIDETRLATPPDSKLALAGAWVRFFPLGGRSRVRPYLTVGMGYSTAGATLGSCTERSIAQADAQDAAGMQVGLESPAPRLAPSECSREGITQATRRHQGLGFTFGIGVRFDPTIAAFDEEWRLPITLELGYVKNVWLGMERKPAALWEDSQGPAGADGRLQDDAAAVAGNEPNLDYLGLLLTFGFLR